jgi:hypothetical protein
MVPVRMCGGSGVRLRPASVPESGTRSRMTFAVLYLKGDGPDGRIYRSSQL